ncbi:helix-turn-helix transcriptional regulator [Oerskovia sp. NPDC057915]|uniref:helix-turn-helix transcriptional regulator n=1 Tax=Oerskovia sp. NPDC057915 TaxID=3346280 RepID=UPI0036DC662C
MPTSSSLVRHLRSAEVADLLGVDVRTLAGWRHKNTGPAFVRIGPGRGATVRYREDVVTAWLDAHTITTRAAETIAAQAPPFTAEQVDALGAILRGA